MCVVSCQGQEVQERRNKPMLPIWLKCETGKKQGSLQWTTVLSAGRLLGARSPLLPAAAMESQRNPETQLSVRTSGEPPAARLTPADTPRLFESDVSQLAVTRGFRPTKKPRVSLCTLSFVLFVFAVMAQQLSPDSRALFELLSQEGKTRNDELKESLAKDIMGKVTQAIDESEKRMDEKLMKMLEERDQSRDDKVKKMEDAIEGLTTGMEQIKMSIGGKGGGKGWKCPNDVDLGGGAWGQGPKAKRGCFGEEAGQQYHEPNVWDEAVGKKKLEVRVEGFKGNSTNDYRVAAIKEFLSKLTIQGGDVDVRAYGRTGSDAVIIFKTETAANAFIKDHSARFQDFLPEGVDGKERRMKFRGYLGPKELKRKNATNVYGAILRKIHKFDDEENFYYNGYRGHIMIKDFKVASITVGSEGVSVRLDKRNIQDSAVDGLADILERAKAEFITAWRE